MQNINRLGLKVVGITALAVLLVAGLVVGIRAAWNAWQRSDEMQTGESQTNQNTSTLANQQDSDNDGLADIIEPVYKTDPNNPDTDGDGVLDGEEVTLLRDPTKAGPDDELFGGDTEVLAEDTYTNRYLKTLPTDVSREDVLSQEKLEAFVAQERGSLLPSLSQGEVKTNEEAGEEAVTAYLGTISSVHNDAVTAVSSEQITQAFTLHYTQNDSAQLNTILQQLDRNLAVFREATAPAEAEILHTTLLQATQALRNNVELLQKMPQDFVGGLIGAKNIEDLGPIFEDIAGQVRQLETQYNIE